jgi:hypothetical protein
VTVVRRSAVPGSRAEATPPAQGDAASPPPPELQPPGSRPASDQEVNRNAYRRLWLWLAVGLTLAVAVVAVLPRLVDFSAQPPAAPVTAQRPPDRQAPAEPAAERKAAERELRAFLQLRARLELAGAQRWGEPDWSRAAERAVEGDQQFARRAFGAAAQAYGAARQVLEALEAGRDQRLAAALDSAQRALQADHVAAALAGFELVLLIEPDHPQATEGLARARVRDQVLTLLDTARQSQQASELDSARSAYQEALRLDPQYTAAADALQQVEQRLADDAFQRAMSEALTALDAGRLQAARQSLEQAASIRPGDAGVGDARRRLADARRSATLKRLRAGASARVASEDWSAALDLYRQALKVQPGAAFARQGSARAERRQRLHGQLDDLLGDPARLHSPELLAGAERLLASIGTVPDNEPRLAGKLASLQSRVDQAKTPVKVTLHSDGETEVVIYHLGGLGRFQVHHLELRPGTYTAVGSRPGFRDVRKVFRVQPGSPPPPLLVRCEEPV